MQPQRPAETTSWVESSGGQEARYLSPDELRSIEQQHPDGISSAAIVEIFAGRGERFSAATLRKYVQLGLLPRSRRVGHKGKHRGSAGLYPMTVVRRINVIRRMMQEGVTLGDIRTSFVCFKNEIDALESALERVFGGIEQSIRSRELPDRLQRDVRRGLQDSRKRATELVRRLERMGSAVTALPVEQVGS